MSQEDTDRVVVGVIHDVGPAPMALGPTDIHVGGCTVYEGGPHVLVTLDQRNGNEVEVALTVDEALALGDQIADAIEGWCYQ